jgi:hypothetical protein
MVVILIVAVSTLSGVHCQSSQSTRSTEQLLSPLDPHEHSAPLLSWQDEKSLRLMISEAEKKSFHFPTLKPLSSNRMDAGFRGSGSFAETDPRPWLSLFQKLARGDTVHVHVFGGSMTEGYGCRGFAKHEYFDSTRICAWPHRLVVCSYRMCIVICLYRVVYI